MAMSGARSRNPPASMACAIQRGSPTAGMKHAQRRLTKRSAGMPATRSAMGSAP